MKLAIFTDLEWSLGALHRALQEQLVRRGHEVTLVSWATGYTPDSWQSVAGPFDTVMTLPPCVGPLHALGVARNKIAIVAHAESDIQRMIRSEGVDAFATYGGYAVTSDTLACSSMAMGVRRIPDVLRCGIEFDRFFRAPPRELKTIGYATIMSRLSEHGLEQK